MQLNWIKIFLLLELILSQLTFGFSQAVYKTIIFNRTTTNYAKSIVEMDSNKFFLVGVNDYDSYLIKMDGDGNRFSETYPFNSRIVDIDKLSSNKLVYISESPWGISSASICDSTGQHISTVLASNAFTGNGPNLIPTREKVMVFDDNHFGYVAAGCNCQSGYEPNVAKFNSTGGEIFSFNSIAFANTECKDGGLLSVIVRSTDSLNLTKIDSNGNFLWERNLFPTFDTSTQFYTILQDAKELSNGDILYFTILERQSDYELFFMRFDSLGLDPVVSNSIIPKSQMQIQLWGSKAFVLKNGEIILCNEGSNCENDIWFFNRNHQLEWIKEMRFTFNQVKLASNGKYYGAGSTTCGNGNSNSVLAIFDSTGNGITKLEDELKKDEIFELYPNPASEKLTVNVPQNGKSKLSIYCFTGRLLFEKVIESNGIVLDIKDIPKGLHIVRLENGNNQLHKKILVK